MYYAIIVDNLRYMVTDPELVESYASMIQGEILNMYLSIQQIKEGETDD